MLTDLARAAALLAAAPVRRTLLISLALSVVLIAAMVPLVDWLLGLLGSTGYAWVDRLTAALGALGTLLVGWFLFPVLLASVMGLFLDAVVDAAEHRHRPGLPPPRKVPLAELVAGTARFAVVAVTLNVLCLPLYLVPGVNLPLFILVNGYLFGREYVELVAQRRMGTAAARAFRSRHQGVAWRIGLVTAALAWLPFVNLVAPLIGSAFATLQLHRRGLDATPTPAHAAPD